MTCLCISETPPKAVDTSGSPPTETGCICSADQHDSESGGHAIGSSLGDQLNVQGSPVQETVSQQLQQQLAGLGLSPTTLAAELAW